jgi:hydroxylamine reductase (hybrid-cluster protein)
MVMTLMVPSFGDGRKSLASSEDVWSVGELVLYGLKGLAAYAHHASVLGKEDPEVGPNDLVLHTKAMLYPRR